MPPNIPIDPMVDCVFKALLGSVANKNLLVHFLNAILRPASPVVDVEIVNPYNEREFETDKLTVVDVKATDASGAWFQVEVQVTVSTCLPQRMLYTWADVYRAQLSEGDAYHTLRPVRSIWLLRHALIPGATAHHHRFCVHDPGGGHRLHDDLEIHVLELARWRPPAHLVDAEDVWLYFFKEAGRWTELPSDLDTPEMRQAMATLKRFTEKQRAYFQYQARQNFLRQQATDAWAMEKARKELQEVEEQLDAVQRQREAAERELETVARQREAAERECEAAEREREAADARAAEAEARAVDAAAAAERFRQRLLAAGIDPDA